MELDINFLFGFIPVALGVIFWAWPRHNHKRLAWRTMSSVPLITGRISHFDNVLVLVDGRQHQRATLWTGKIWNHGLAPIRDSDLPSKLTIQFEGAETAAAHVAAVARQDSSMATQVDRQRNVVILSFLFLNSGDGGVLSVLHTGPPELLPRLEGAVIGGTIRDYSHNAAVASGGERITTALLCCFALIFAFTVGVYVGRDDWRAGVVTTAILLLSGVVGVLLGAWTERFRMRREPHMDSMITLWPK